MSVLVSDRTPSDLEVIVFASELHDMLREFMQRSFGVKDLEQFVRVQFAYGRIESEDFWKYRYLMHTHKAEIDRLCTMLTSNVRAANKVRATNDHKLTIRRDFQDAAIVCCDQIVKELQRVVDDFEVDVNKYARYIEAIDREISLITGWRESDSRRFRRYAEAG